jgi:hypothetical protein
MPKNDFDGVDFAAGCMIALVWLVVVLANMAFWGWIGYLFYFWLVN